MKKKSNFQIFYQKYEMLLEKFLWFWWKNRVKLWKISVMKWTRKNSFRTTMFQNGKFGLVWFFCRAPSNQFENMFLLLIWIVNSLRVDFFLHDWFQSTKWTVKGLKIQSVNWWVHFPPTSSCWMVSKKIHFVTLSVWKGIWLRNARVNKRVILCHRYCIRAHKFCWDEIR